MSRLYSEKELLKAMDFACRKQKVKDYQDVTVLDAMLFLHDTDNNESKSITIKDIEEHLKDN